MVEAWKQIEILFVRLKIVWWLKAISKGADDQTLWFNYNQSLYFTQIQKYLVTQLKDEAMEGTF